MIRPQLLSLHHMACLPGRPGQLDDPVKAPGHDLLEGQLAHIMKQTCEIGQIRMDLEG